MSKINVYVNSRKRKTDESASNFSVIVPDGLLKVNKDQYFTMSVNSFYCYNDFYQCNSNSNYFILMFRTNTNAVYTSQDMYLDVGNPNVYDVVSNINAKCSTYLTCSYDNVKNKLLFTRTYTQTSNSYNMYIKTVNSGNFFGFVNNVENLIATTGTLSTSPVNVNSIVALSVGIDGDISFNYNNMESSVNNSVYKASDLIFQTSVNVPKGYLIDYQNVDGGDSFKYNLGNTDRIKYFILSVYNQDGNTITDMTNYIIHIQFAINNKSRKEELMRFMIDYSKQSYLVLGHIFEIIHNIYVSVFKIKSNP